MKRQYLLALARQARDLIGALLLAMPAAALAQSLPNQTDGNTAQAHRIGGRLQTRNKGYEKVVTRIPSRIATRLQSRLDNSYRSQSGLLDPLEQSRTQSGASTIRP